MAEPGEVLGGRYALERRIGSGGMGDVWLARHVTLGSPAALKILRPEAAQFDRSLARFQREAKLLARMSSAHVVKVLDHGHHDDLPFIVMEYLEGESLQERLKARGRLSLVDTSEVVKQVCRALSQAHTLGLVHRDIKPGNIFIAKAEADGTEIIKVLDFGVAKGSDVLTSGGFEPTESGALLGTPYYVSPEQAEGRPSIDHRADLWSLGVVSFECLTGQRPFQAPSIGALLALIGNGPIPLMSDVAPDAGITRELDAWMGKALSRYREARFASAQEMADTFFASAGLSRASQLPQQPRAAAAPMAGTMMLDNEAAMANSAAVANAAALAPTALHQAPGGAAGAQTQALNGPPMIHMARPPGVKTSATEPMPPRVAPGHAYGVPPQPQGYGAAPMPYGMQQAAQTNEPVAAEPSIELPVRSNVGLIVGALAVILLAGGGGAWWAVRNRAAPETDTAEETAEAAASSDEAAVASAEAEVESGDEAEAESSAEPADGSAAAASAKPDAKPDDGTLVARPVSKPDPQPSDTPDPKPTETPAPKPAETPKPKPAEPPKPKPSPKPPPIRREL